MTKFSQFVFLLIVKIQPKRAAPLDLEGLQRRMQFFSSFQAMPSYK
jgi:hypothetical protein